MSFSESHLCPDGSVYAKLKEHDTLSKYAVVKTFQNLRWDIHVCNASGKWEIEVVTKSARQVLDDAIAKSPQVLFAARENLQKCNSRQSLFKQLRSN